MEIVIRNLSELRTPEYNVRRHTDKQLKEFVRSIEKFGQIRPIVIDEDGMILCGNGLRDALVSMGRETGECLLKSGLSEAEKKKLMLADNRIFDLGVDDIAAFDAIIAELNGDFDIPGYDDSFLESLIADAEETTAVLSEYGTVDGDEAESIRQAAEEPVRPVRQTPQNAEPTAEPSQNPVATAEEAPQSAGTEGGRFVVCPRCGEKIWL